MYSVFWCFTEHPLDFKYAKFAEPHDVIVAVVHIDCDLFPLPHIEIVGGQGEALVPVRQALEHLEDFRLNSDKLVNALVDGVLQLDKAVKAVRVFRAGDDDAVKGLGHVRQPVVRVAYQGYITIDFLVYLSCTVQPLSGENRVFVIAQISSPQNKSM